MDGLIPPLNEDGIKIAEKRGEELKNSGIDRIYSSDLGRAAQTAQKVNESIKAPITVDPSLRPWNVGNFAGQESKTVAPHLEKLARENPDTPAPGGESFNQFKDRFLTGVQKIYDQNPDKHILFVAHHRNDMILRAWEKQGQPENKDVHIDTFTQWKKGVEPGEVRDVPLPTGDARVPHTGPKTGTRTPEEMIQDMKIWNPKLIDPKGYAKPPEEGTKDKLPAQGGYMPWVKQDEKYSDIKGQPESKIKREIPISGNPPNVYTNHPIPKDYLISPHTGKPISLPDLLKVMEMKKQVDRDAESQGARDQPFEKEQEILYKKQHSM